MRYELIWKSIDQEITKEENELLLKELIDPANEVVYKKVNNLNSQLKSHFNPVADASFLSRLKATLIEELELPQLNINYTPALIFGVFAIMLTLILSFTTPSIWADISSSTNAQWGIFYNSSFVVLGIMILIGLDTFFKKKYKL